MGIGHTIYLFIVRYLLEQALRRIPTSSAKFSSRGRGLQALIRTDNVNYYIERLSEEGKLR